MNSRKNFRRVAALGLAFAFGFSGPYDAIPQIISKYVKKIPYAVIRMIYDLSAIAIGWLLGSTVGVVSIVTGFFLGPIIAAIAKKFRPWFA